MRSLVVTTHPIQYQAPLFRKLARDLDLTVLFMMKLTSEGQAVAGFGVNFDWDVPLLEGYEHVFAENNAKDPSPDRRNGIVLQGHDSLLKKLNPDVIVILGWFPKGYLQITKWAERNATPIVCRGESNLISSRSIMGRMAKEAYFRWLFPKFTTFAVIGKLNREFYRHYQVPESKLHWAPYSIDTDHFQAEFRKHRPAMRAPGPWRIGFSAKLIPRKRPHDLLRAVAKSSCKQRVQVVFIGDGPLRIELEQAVQQLGLVAEFRGFFNQSEIVAKGYADLDALVLPSGERETWGLVVNEAMTGGIPVIASDLVGSAADLIDDGVTGYTFRSGDVGHLAQAIDRLIARLEDGFDFGPAVLKRIAGYSLARTAAGMEEAIEEATA